MSVTIFFSPYETSDMSNTDLHYPIKPTKNLVLEKTQPVLLKLGQPTFTSLNMKIYSDDNNSPGKLLYSSTNNVTQTEINNTLSDSANNKQALVFPVFEFNKITLRKNDLYHFVINGSGYSTADSEADALGWIKAWPDPIYEDGITKTYVDLIKNPYQMAIIGSIF